MYTLVYSLLGVFLKTLLRELGLRFGTRGVEKRIGVTDYGLGSKTEVSLDTPYMVSLLIWLRLQDSNELPVICSPHFSPRRTCLCRRKFLGPIVVLDYV